PMAQKFCDQRRKTTFATQSPQKRTFGRANGMSALGHHRTVWRVFARCVLSCEGLGAGIEDDDEGALMGFAGSMREICCPSQLGFAGAGVTPSGISTQGSFSAHQICRLGATQLGSSSV